MLQLSCGKHMPVHGGTAAAAAAAVLCVCAAQNGVHARPTVTLSKPYAGATQAAQLTGASQNSNQSQSSSCRAGWAVSMRVVCREGEHWYRKAGTGGAGQTLPTRAGPSCSQHRTCAHSLLHSCASTTSGSVASSREVCSSKVTPGASTAGGSPPEGITSRGTSTPAAMGSAKRQKARAVRVRRAGVQEPLKQFMSSLSGYTRCRNCVTAREVSRAARLHHRSMTSALAALLPAALFAHRLQSGQLMGAAGPWRSLQARCTRGDI